MEKTITKKSTNHFSLLNKPAFVSVASSLICVAFGLIIGLIILLCINSASAFPAFGDLFTYGFSSNANIAMFIYRAAPLIFTGLAVAFTFKAGLFNIGGSGQYVMGAGVALIFAIYFKLPWYVDILVAAVAGAIWGALPGLLKAFFNVNEVISAIMLNWIGLFFMEILLSNIPGMADKRYSNHTVGIISTVNKDGLLPTWGMESFNKNMTIGIFIAIIFAIIAWVVVNKTTFGYSLKACGQNKYAARYAGIPDRKNIIISFMISGAFAAIGGAINYLSPSVTQGFSFEATSLPSAGFDGISVALLASNNPIACILSALFISFLNVSGEVLQGYGYAPELFSVITGVIVYSASFVLLIKQWMTSTKSGRKAFLELKKRLQKRNERWFGKSNSTAVLTDERKTNLAIRLAENNPIPEEEIKKNNAVKNVRKDFEKFVDKEVKDQKKEDQDNFTITSSPFSRDLKGYDPDNISNLDNAELIREPEPKDEKKGDK